MPVAVAASPEPGNVPPRIRLDIVNSGTPTYTTVNVVRLDADGRTRPVRTSDGNPLTLTTSGSNRVGLLYDYEMPYGTTVQYGTVEGGFTSDAVSVTSASAWLVHPGAPARSVQIDFRIGSFDEVSNDVVRGVFTPLGRENAVVITDGQRKGDDTSFVVSVDTATDLAALKTILADAQTLMLQVPTGLAMGVGSAYIAVGRVTYKRRSTIGTDPYRDVTLPYMVVDRPAGGSQAQRTYADVLAENATYAAVLSRYATYADVLAPTS